MTTEHSRIFSSSSGKEQRATGSTSANRKIEIKASCYRWDREKGKPIEDYSVIWGIVKNIENKKVAVKFIVKFDEKKIAIWITDLLSILTMQKMFEDFVRMKEGKTDDDIDELLPKLTEGVNMVLAELRKGDAQGKRYEQVVLELCETWNFTKEQTQKVLALMLGTAKLVEEMFISRGESMAYIY